MVMSISSKNNYNVIHDAAIDISILILVLKASASLVGLLVNTSGHSFPVILKQMPMQMCNANAFLALVVVDQMTVID